MKFEGKRIRDLREKLKITQAELAENIGVTQKTITFWENEKNEPEEKYILTICNKYNIEKEFFYTNNVIFSDNIEKVTLDYYPDVFGSCGNGAFVLSDIKEKIQIPKQAFFQGFSNKKTYSVINAVGNSMEPLIYDKDKVIIEHFDGGQIMDNKPYIFCYKDEIFIKRLAKNVNQLMIIPENKMYDIIKLTKEEMNDVYVIGQIVGLMRDLR